MSTKPIVKNMFSPSEQVESPPGEKRAKQEFKQDADINSIMAKFQKTGAIDHASKYQPLYGIASPQTLQEAMNTVTAAQTMFEELPSSLRVKFNNRPQDFLEFIQNPDNKSEAIKLGLTSLSDEAEKLVQEPVVPQLEKEPKSALGQESEDGTSSEK